MNFGDIGETFTYAQTSVLEKKLRWSRLYFFSAAAPFLFLLWLSSHKVLLSATLISKRAKVRKIVVHTQSWVSRTLYNSSKQFSPFSSRTHVRELRIEAILHQIHFFNWKSTESVLKTLNMKQAEKTAPMDVIIIKFIYSEKATKFCEISTNYLSYVLPVK